MAAARQQLPPQIRKVAVTDRRTGKPVVRYQVTADVGVDAETGKRRQVRRRFTTEREARQALAEISDQAARGVFTPRRSLTVAEFCESYIAGRHNLRETSRAKLEYDLSPLVQRHGALQLQRLTKGHIDGLVKDLVAGGTTSLKGRKRKPWSSESVNKFIGTVAQALDDAHRQGLVARNVAAQVTRVASRHKDVDTFTEAEVLTLLAAVEGDRLAHAWELALSGLRRGEVAGLRWSDIDLDAGTLTIANNRVSAAGRIVENDPKSATSRRTLPLPDRLAAVLRTAKRRQTEERLAIGPAYRSGEYVVSNEIGDPHSPAVLSRYWRDMLAANGIRHIKFHAARHTCATLMHLQGVPVAVIAAWIGHKDASLTLRLYAHSQTDALKAAGESLNRVVTTRDTQTS